MSGLPFPSKDTIEKLYKSLTPHPSLVYGIIVTLLIIFFMNCILQKPEVTTNHMVVICSSLLVIVFIGVVSLRVFDNQDSQSKNKSKNRIDTVKNSYGILTVGGDSE